MDSVLRQRQTEDDYFNFNGELTYGIDAAEFPPDISSVQMHTDSTSDSRLNEKGSMTSTLLPPSFDCEIYQPNQYLSGSVTASADAHDPLAPSPIQAMDTLDIDYAVNEEALNQWCQAIASNPDNSSMFQFAEQSITPLGDVYPSGSSYPRKQSLFNATSTVSTDTDPNSCNQTPDLTECSTPITPTISDDLSSVTAATRNDLTTDNQRWHATEIRSRAADSSFLYGVLTTKIFCRPSCASRRPSRRHVRFFPFPGAIEAAEQVKLRPCKRCKPELLGTVNTGVLGICQVLRAIIAETNKQAGVETKKALKLDSLAQSAGLSTFHFHRLFKTTTQVTPGDFINACRSLALQDALGQDNSLTSGMSVDANQSIEKFSCWSSRTARKALGGISPSEYTKGALSVGIEYCCCDTPCGSVCVMMSKGKAVDEMKIHAVLLGSDAEKSANLRFPRAKASDAYQNNLRRCLRELEEEARDRDSELIPDVLPSLWRTRVWLKLVQR